MFWRVESKISSRYSISTLWFNLNTWVKHLDSTQILESRILTWIESWRVKYLTWTQVLDLMWLVYLSSIDCMHLTINSTIVHVVMTNERINEIFFKWSMFQKKTKWVDNILIFNIILNCICFFIHKWYTECS